MQKLAVFFTVVFSLALLVPVASQGQEKKDAKKDKVTKEDTTPQDYAYLAQIKEIAGRISAVDVKNGTMTLTIEWSHWEPNKNMAAKGGNPNQKALQLQQQIMRDYEQIMRTKNPLQRDQA